MRLLLALAAAALASAALPRLQEIGSANGTLDTTLRIGVHRVETDVLAFDAKVFNGLFPGPVLRVRKGETLRVLVANGLSGDNPDPGINRMRQPLTFSFHTHGLHVSPSGLSDNIFLEVHPGQEQQHVIEIPPDHAPGTHWYHAHHHGSSMLHVLKGLIGTIVVEDDDSVPLWLQQMREEVIVMHYMNLEELQDLQEVIGDPIALNADQRQSLNAFYTINGAYSPTMDVVAQDWVRLRLVHASYGPQLKLQIRSRGGGACAMWLLSNDGVSLDRPRPVQHVVFVPGSRRDIALRCDAGSYEVLGVQGAGGGGRDRLWFTGVVMLISATSGAAGVSAEEAARPAMAQRDLWSSPKPHYLSDLRGRAPDQTYAVEFGDPDPFSTNGAFIGASAALAIASCASCALGAGCLYRRRNPGDQKRSCLAGLSTRQRLLACGLCAVPLVALIVVWIVLLAQAIPLLQGEAVNGVAYNGEVMVQMKVDTLQEWTLGGAEHPFHMHTNHFQVIEHGQSDDFVPGEWYDGVPADGLIRFYTDRFTGTLVLHCHHLEHEDEGMMAKIEIVP